MAFEPEVIPPATIHEITMLGAGRIVSEVSATDFLGRLSQFSSLPRLMEGTHGHCVHTHANDLLATSIDTFRFEGVVARPEEPVELPSLFYSPIMAQLVISIP